jgi:hypothetical protein
MPSAWDAGKLALEGVLKLVDGDPCELVIRVRRTSRR